MLLSGLTRVADRGAFVVTGCGGFLGSRTAALLLARGESVRGVDLMTSDLYPSEPKERRISELMAMPNFEFHAVDLRTAPLASILAGSEAVLHFAALAGLAGSWTDPKLYESHNVDATRHLLEAMAQSGGAFLVHASTSSVYGTHAVGDEGLPLTPVSPYGVTKLAAEDLVRRFDSAGLVGATILRFFSVYGPNQRPDMAYSKLCRALLAGTEMTVNGDGLQRRSNTFIDDAASAAIAAADRRLGGEIFNIAGRESASLLEAIALLADAIGVTKVFEHGPPQKGDQHETRGNSARAMRLLGWRPETSLKEGLKAQARAARVEWDSVRSREGVAS